jgi:hypothetical protein
MRTLKNVTGRLFAAILAVASLASAAQAQHSSFAAKVNVPFAFDTASGQHFQPGIYAIGMNGLQTVQIRGDKSAGLIMVSQAANQGLPIAQGKAVFTHYGDRYYLHSISLTGDSTKFVFATSKVEREQQIASGNTRQTVELALLQAGR